MSNDHNASSSQAKREFEGPVAWLLGRDLMRSLKGTLLYAAYGPKLDPRDWMQASVFPSLDEDSWGKDREDKKEFWFDYLADTGDGMKAVYSLAYLCLGDLWITKDQMTLPNSDRDREVKHRTEIDDNGKAEEASGYETKLPRGELLFVGGDTAYHLSDYMTLATRFQLPFKWAFEDRLKSNPELELEPRRPIFGIPGNHDYYDQLDGFRRQFRKTTREEPSGMSSGNPNEPHLVIEGFYRTQNASYVAIQLPFEWWIWGLDTEAGQVDNRQEKFFRQAHSRDSRDQETKFSPPDKLIVATCSPTTYFGKLAAKDDGKAATALGQIGLSQPFWPKIIKREDGSHSFKKITTGNNKEKIDLESAGDAKLKPGQCRLDISGDVHLYARYWGPKNKPGKEPIRRHAKADAPDALSYASVVSGIGGAFHHPSTTYVDDLKEQALYPSENVSRKAIARKIFNPINIIRGGYVWLIGLIMAFTICFAATVPQSSRQFIRNLPLLTRLGFTRPEQIRPTVGRIGEFDEATRSELSRRVPAATPNATPTTELVYLNQIRMRQWPADFKWGMLFLTVSLIFIIVTFLKSKWIFGAEDKAGSGPDQEEKASVVEKVEDEFIITAEKRDKESGANPLWKMLLVVLLISVSTLLGIVLVGRYRLHITPFGNSLMVLYSIICAIAGIALSIRYSDFLFEKSHAAYIGTYDWTWPWVLSLLSIGVVVIGMVYFGRNNLPALLAFDIFFFVVVFGLALAMILAAVFKGGELQPWWGKILFGIVGIVHAILQIATPFLLVKKGTWLTLLAAVGLLIIFSLLGWITLSSKKRLVYRWGLTVLGLFYGGAMITLPYLASPGLSHDYFATWADQRGWAGFLVSLVAGLVGALMCCVWFAWYLAVCFVFNGHNNEVGGAGQIEDYKQFIRFRLTKKTLTGYVIAVDKVGMIDEPTRDGKGKKDGSYLRPHLIDVFHLVVKPEVPGA